ncbi:MAG: DNA/RNA nuclease SfsA [Haloarculaceae archaeon]
MATEVLETDADLIEGRLVRRQNRFVLDVAFDDPAADDDQIEEVYLPETGRLTTVLVDDATVVCEPVEDPDRRTAFTALAVHNGDVYVTVEAVRANAMLAEAVERDLVPVVADWDLVRREPALPDGGRADLLVSGSGAEGIEGGGGAAADGATAEDSERYVEVKAVTHAEDGVGKFPDAPTERGRRHLRDLTALAEDGVPASVVFVAMRPDVEVVRPFREIDPDFAAALEAAAEAGVGVHAVGSAFDPPVWTLAEESIPVELA